MIIFIFCKFYKKKSSFQSKKGLDTGLLHNFTWTDATLDGNHTLILIKLNPGETSIALKNANKYSSPFLHCAAFIVFRICS